MTIKLDRQKRWLSFRKHLDQKFGVKVHFPDKHSNYYEAWKYVTKDDNNYILSEGHLDSLDEKILLCRKIVYQKMSFQQQSFLP